MSLSAAELATFAEDLENFYKGRTHRHYVRFYQSLVKHVPASVLPIANVARFHLFNQTVSYQQTKAIPKTDSQAQRALFSALIFIVNCVESEGEVSIANSTLLALIKNKINITTNNPYSDQKRFIDIVHLYHYINEITDFSQADELISILELIKFKSTAEKLMADLLMKSIAKIRYVFIAPTLDSVQEKLKKLTNDYQSSRFWQDQVRIAQILFFRYIGKSSEYLYAEEDNKAIFSSAYRVHMGAIYYVAREIEETYKYKSISSNLYLGCLEILNVKKLSDINNEIIIAWLEKLKEHLQVSAQWESVKILTDKINNSANYINNIPEKITPLLAELHLTLNNKSSTSYEKMTNYAKVAGFSATVGVVASQVLMPAMGGAIDAAAGLMGCAALGPFGGCVAIRLSYLLREKLVTDAVGCAFAFLIDKMGYLFSEDSKEFRALDIKLTQEGFDKLLSLYKAQVGEYQREVEVEFIEWCEAFKSVGNLFFTPTPTQQASLRF